jgi:UDP-N-acetylmuramoyl-L-alanyl-D-glutamate--2,6-diaminopimelate ligase
MGGAAARGSDEIYLTSDNPRTEDPSGSWTTRKRGSARSPARPRACTASPTAARRSPRPWRTRAPGDAVVIAGKGHEDVQILADRTIPFDDRLVAAECLELRLGRG